jgi:nucleoside-diphosphate-sugar epimerase
MIFVTGATGNVGRKVVQNLHQAGDKVGLVKFIHP